VRYVAKLKIRSFNFGFWILDFGFSPRLSVGGLRPFWFLVKQNEKPHPEKAELVGKV
jgi:hypothetical protein